MSQMQQLPLKSSSSLGDASTEKPESTCRSAPPPLTKIRHRHVEQCIATRINISRNALPSPELDSAGILLTFHKALDKVVDKRLKDFGKAQQNSKKDSFDVFDKWLEGNGTRRYSTDDPNAMQQKSGWVMRHVSSRDNIVETSCAGVIECTSCHLNDFKHPSDRRLKPAYQPATFEEDRYKLLGKKCPENCCNGVLIHKSCRGYRGAPVMQRWHIFKDAIVFENLGVHDHPRPCKEYRNVQQQLPLSRITALGTTLGEHSYVVPRDGENSNLVPNKPKAKVVSNSEQNTTKVNNKTYLKQIHYMHNASPPVQNVPVNESLVHHEAYALTMGIVGCLPDNVQKAIKSFSIKPGKQHITFSFPFMAEILRHTALICATRSRGLHHITPMLLCDHSLGIVEGFDVVLTLVTDLQRCVVNVVHMTLYQSDSKEGVQRHYATLLTTMLEGLPHGLKTMANHLKLPSFVLLSDDCDPEDIATSLSETLMNVYSAEFVVRRSTSTDVLLGLRENVILPCIISRAYAFRLAITDVTSRLPEEDTDRFVALVQYMLSDKCSEVELKKTDLLLKNPAFVSLEVRQFWALWGHELVAPKIFPIARDLWNSDVVNENNFGDAPSLQDDDSSVWFHSWREILTLNSSDCKPTFKEILQRLVHALKAQGLTEELDAPDTNGSKQHPSSVQPAIFKKCVSESDVIPDKTLSPVVDANHANRITTTRNNMTFQGRSADNNRQYKHNSADGNFNIGSFHQISFSSTSSTNVLNCAQFKRSSEFDESRQLNSAAVSVRLPLENETAPYLSMFSKPKSTHLQQTTHVPLHCSCPICHAPSTGLHTRVRNMYTQDAQANDPEELNPRMRTNQFINPRAAPYDRMQRPLSIAGNKNNMYCCK